ARALSDATFVELANQDGVFPQRTSAVLARLGSPAVTVILDHFQVNGVFEPASSNWKSRRYLVRALGAIEDRRAADT
ncbi:MAG: hypothetical protein L6Q71_10670, partial [Planctomycetes bacterium]|nr:hypothetical protein [Planctomycetota bacterium]